MKIYIFKKKVFAGLLGIILIIFFVSLLGVSRQQTRSTTSEPIIGKADIKVEKMELSETNGEDLEWSIKAEKAELYEKQGVAYLRNITLAYSVEGGKEVVLTGDRGKINLSKKNVFLEGNVKASSHQIQLKTEALSWFREKGLLLTEYPVWLKRENIEITGKGMVADIDLWKIKLNREVETAIY